MTTKQKFIQTAKEEGLNEDQIIKAMAQRRLKIGVFDDDTQPDQTSQEPVNRLFNLPPKVEKAFFPRAVETREKGGGILRQAIPGALDILSIPGRAIASIPALIPGGETPQAAFARKEARSQKGIGKVGEFIGSTLRDPITALITGATGGASIPAKAVGKPIIKKIASTVLKGAKEQIVPAITRQAEISSREGEVDLPRQFANAAIESALGGVGEGVGKGISTQISPWGKKLLQGTLKTKDVTAKLAGPNVAKGAENIVNDIVNFKLESKVGGFKGMGIKASKIINKKSKKLDEVVEGFSKGNPDATLNLDAILNQLKFKIQQGKTEIVGGEKAAGKMVDQIRETLKLRNLAGKQPISKIRDVKAIINQLSQPFDKGPFTTPGGNKKIMVGRLAYRAINEKFGEQIPAAKVLGQELRRLIVVEQALLEAQKRSSNHNFLSLRNSIMISGGINSKSPQGIFASIAAMMFNIVTEKGRGASAVISTGRQQALPKFLRVLGGEGAAFWADQGAQELERKNRIIIPQKPTPLIQFPLGVQ